MSRSCGPNPSDPQPTTPTPTRRRRRWPWIVGGIVALLLIITVANGGGSTETEPAAAPETVAPAPEPAPAPAPQPQPEPAPEPVQDPAAAEEIPGDPAAIGDGTYIVGDDIEPGTYRSPGAAPSGIGFCYWTTHDGPSGNSTVVDLGSATSADEPMVVEIDDSVGAFKTAGCSEWTRTP